jgi:hypothetical protein
MEGRTGEVGTEMLRLTIVTWHRCRTAKRPTVKRGTHLHPRRFPSSFFNYDRDEVDAYDLSEKCLQLLNTDAANPDYMDTNATRPVV